MFPALLELSHLLRVLTIISERIGGWGVFRESLGWLAGFCSGGAAKNPEGLVGGVVLARIDMDEQLRLALLQRNKRGKRGDEQRR